MPDNRHSPQEEKARIRDQVFALLLDASATGQGPIALPDAIFDHQLEHFITDFQGSREAVHRLSALPEWQRARRVFVTPDNSTQYLRELAIRQSKELIMTTYGIRRGSLRVTRGQVPEGQEEYASTLVGMEKFGRRLRTIADLVDAGPLDLMVTGALAVSRAHGGRAGKGAGWFDAEWGIWRSLGLVQPATPVAGIVHGVQVVPQAFALDPWDCHLNLIATPEETIRVPVFEQPPGVLWDLLTTPAQWEWMVAIPYMRELYSRVFGKEIMNH